MSVQCVFPLLALALALREGSPEASCPGTSLSESVGKDSTAGNWDQFFFIHGNTEEGAKELVGLGIKSQMDAGPDWKLGGGLYTTGYQASSRAKDGWKTDKKGQPWTGHVWGMQNLGEPWVKKKLPVQLLLRYESDREPSVAVVPRSLWYAPGYVGAPDAKGTWGEDPEKKNCMQNFDLLVVPHPYRCKEVVKMLDQPGGCQMLDQPEKYVERDCFQEYKWNPLAQDRLRLEYVAKLGTFSAKLGSLPFGEKAKGKLRFEKKGLFGFMKRRKS